MLEIENKRLRGVILKSELNKQFYIDYLTKSNYILPRNKDCDLAWLKKLFCGEFWVPKAD